MTPAPFFFFVRLVTPWGEHLATETIWTESRDPADIVSDAASYFGMDDNGALEPEVIAASVIECYGPFTLGDATRFTVTEDDDGEFQPVAFAGLDHAFLAVKQRRGQSPRILGTFKIADYPNADAAYAACDDVIDDQPGHQLIEVGEPGEPLSKPEA